MAKVSVTNNLRQRNIVRGNYALTFDKRVSGVYQQSKLYKFNLHLFAKCNKYLFMNHKLLLFIISLLFQTVNHAVRLRYCELIAPVILVCGYFNKFNSSYLSIIIKGIFY